MIRPEDIVITHKRNKKMEDQRGNIGRATELYLEGMAAKHIMNAQLLLDSPVGVAEHPDIIETIQGELGKISEYRDKLAALRELEW